MKHGFFIGILLVLLVGCTTNPPQPQSMVLEGWIDANGYPVVFIHKSYVLADSPDSVRSLEDIVEGQLIPFGKVVVSDGDNEVILTGRLDTISLPPYSYSSLDMVGQVGKRYTVTAQYKDLYATATTTIPPVASLDSLSIRSGETEWIDVRAYMSGLDTCPQSYYGLFMREYGTKQFRLCPLSVFEAQDAVRGGMEIKVYNPLTEAWGFISGGYVFTKNDTVAGGQPREYQLKVARLDDTSYRFWKAYNEQLVTGGVLFLPVYKNIPGNVTGGIGCFSGMGSSVYRFNTARDTTYLF